MKAEILRYISDRYPRWKDFATFQAERQNLGELSVDLLHETMVSLLFMDEKKINKLYEALKKDQNLREIDFYVLRMIRLNAISDTAPFKATYRTYWKKQQINQNEFKLKDWEEDSLEDESIVKLRQIRLIRAVGEALNLNETERMVYNTQILDGETIASILEDTQISKKNLYLALNNVKKAIRLILFINGFTRIEPEKISNRAEELAQGFHERYQIRIINKDSVFENVLILDKMKKQVYWKDEFSLNEQNDNLVNAGKAIQTVVNSFAAIGVQITDPKILADVLDNQRRVIEYKLEKFVFDSLYPDTPSGFNRTRYRDLIDLPDLQSLKEAFEPLTGYFGGMYVRDVIEWTAYSINEGQVEILPAIKSKLEERFTEVAETPDELKRLAVVEELCKTLDKIADLSIEHPGIFAIPGVTQYDETTGKFIPGRMYVKIGGRSSMGRVGNEKAVNLKSKLPENGLQGLTPETPEEERAAAIAKSRNN